MSFANSNHVIIFALKIINTSTISSDSIETFFYNTLKLLTLFKLILYFQVRVRIMCLDGPRDLVFKSAKTCSCFHCKKI